MKKIVMIMVILSSMFAFQSKYLPKKYIETDSCDTVLYKKAFDICYSCRDKIPRIVTYTLDGRKVNLNNYSRKGIRFQYDRGLSKKCRSYSRDYSKSGYDRGHMAPNAAFDYDKMIQKETFLMSNIAPQTPNVNRRLWVKIERSARLQARKYKKVSVVTGNCGSLGKIKRKVVIPKYFYKIIYTPYRKKTIAYLVPNKKKLPSKKITDYLTTVEEIEHVCDIDIKKCRNCR